MSWWPYSQTKHLAEKAPGTNTLTYFGLLTAKRKESLPEWSNSCYSTYMGKLVPFLANIAFGWKKLQGKTL
jgi:hypothetical protein